MTDVGRAYGGGRRRRLLRGAGGLALAAGAGAGGFFAVGGTAQAARSASLTARLSELPGGVSSIRPAVVGTVKAVDTAGNSFTVRTRTGAVTAVDVTSTTTFRDPAVSAAGLGNLAVGDQVAVIGTTSSGVVTAATVLVGVPGGHWRGPGDGPFGPPGGFGGPAGPVAPTPFSGIDGGPGTAA